MSELRRQRRVPSAWGAASAGAAPPPLHSLRDVAARPGRLYDALDPELVRRDARRRVVCLRLLRHLGEPALDDLLEAAVHLVLVPAEVLEVLDPLEVGHDHAARVAEHVWRDVDALVAEDAVRLRGRRAVGPLE